MKFTRMPDEALKLSRRERIGGWTAMVVCNFQILTMLVGGIFVAFGWGQQFFWANMVLYVLNAAITLVVFRQTLVKGFQRMRNDPKRFFVTGALGCLVYYGAAKLVELLLYLLPMEITNTNNAVVTEFLLQHSVPMTLAVCVLAPIAEECFWRVLVFGEVRQFSRPLAYAASTLLFALLHVWQYIGEYSPLNLLLVTVTYLPAGLVLSWVYDRTKSVWCSILVHSAINAAVCLSLFCAIP